MKLFVANIAFRVSDQQLKEHFLKIGDVTSCNIAKDRETGKSRGFGFVEMEEASAKMAISELDGSELGGRNIVVKLAEEKPKN